MKEFVIDVTPEVPAVGVAAEPLALREKLAAFVELTKPRITFLIVLTSAAGFCLGSKGRFDYVALFNSLFGIALLSSGIAALNQYIERGLDGRMRRTLTRPLPSMPMPRQTIALPVRGSEHRPRAVRWRETRHP